jgi:hypothetical protein
MSLSRNRQAAAPFSAPINGLKMRTVRAAIRGEFKCTGAESDHGFKCPTGCWTLDPLAPVVPVQDPVEMSLDGTKEKKRAQRRSRSEMTPPPTVMLRTRRGKIQATFCVVGESALRSVATIHTVTRKGNIVLDVVSL